MASEVLLRKNEKMKCDPVSEHLNLGPQPFRPSKVWATWHIFVLYFVPAPLESWTHIIKLEPTEPDYMEILNLPSNTVSHVPADQRGEH